MKQTPQRRPLERQVEQVLAPLLQARTKVDGVEVLGWDVEQGITLYVRFAGRVLLIEIEPRDDAQPCFDRTPRFNICVRVNFEAGAALTADEARFVAALVRLIARREHLLPAVAQPPASRRTLVRELLVDRVLCAEGDGHYYINPYVGCMIGCEFCYVAQRAELSWAMQGLPKMPWGRQLDVKVNAPEVLRRELAERAPGIVRMSPILTDPYQPVERKYRVTRGCLEVMQPTEFVPFLLTRAIRALDDLELLRRFRHAALGFSIPTDDDRYRQLIEPTADPVEARIAALADFARAGIFTVVVIQPMMPMDAHRFTEKIAPFVKAVRIDRMQFPERIRHLYARHKLDYALAPAWADETEAALRDGLARHGVPIDDADNLVGFLDAELRR